MRIAIIGGGIGGLSAALALRQFGFESEVFEQAPRLLEIGAAIIMWPNAMRVLHRLGLTETIRQYGGAVEQIRWLKRNGKLLNHIRLPETGAPAIALHRADLQQTLLHALPQDSIHQGHVFEACEQQPDKIVARFSDGSSFDCDLLIGADGLHSRARAQLLNDGAPEDCGYTTWRGVVPYTPVSLMPATAIEIYGRGQRFGIGPIGLGKVGWWATDNQNSDNEQAMESAREELARRFDGWCEPVVELIKATPLNSLIKTTVFDRQPVRNWSDGSMVLLGDAIHPTTPNLGQGGCLAIEDAAVLARCLNKYASQSEKRKDLVSNALRRFEALRFARTAAIARYSRLYGVIGQWENRAVTQARNLVLSTFPKVLTRMLLRRVLDYDACAVSI